MKKLTAILLAMLMVSFCFATTVMADETSDAVSSEDAVSSDDAVSSEDATSEDATSEDATSEDAPSIPNLAAGKTYTITSDSETGEATYNGACDDGMGEGYYLTDGIVRDVEELTASGAGSMDKTVELAGTNRTHFVTIELGAAYDLSSVVLGTARRGNNRYTNIASIEVLVNGSWKKVEFVENATVIEGSEQYGSETITPYDQFFNIEATIDAKGATAVKIGIDTFDNTGAISHYGPRGYIAQLDEIEVYGVAATSSDNGNGNGGSTTSPTGDLGLGVFAVLAVVSLAGVVVAKKVK